MTSRQSTTEAPLHFHLIIPNLIAANHKQALKLIAADVSKHIGIKDRILAERLVDLEKDSPSPMGDGVALAHLRISGLNEPMNIFVRFKNSVPFGSTDKRDVDLFCLILTPERQGSSYLRTLSRASRLLRNKPMCAKLKSAKDELTIRAILEQSSLELMAA